MSYRPRYYVGRTTFEVNEEFGQLAYKCVLTDLR